MKCYVYLIECQSPKYKPVKIGMSKNPEKRIEELQIGSAWDLKLIAKIEMGSTKAARALETHLHRALKVDRMCGEWFRVREYQIKAAITGFVGVDKKSRYQKESSGTYGSSVKSLSESDSIDRELDSKVNMQDWL